MAGPINRGPIKRHPLYNWLFLYPWILYAESTVMENVNQDTVTPVIMNPEVLGRKKCHFISNPSGLKRIPLIFFASSK